MKLLNAFREQLKSLGKLRYAWFTSFNINIEFIETYLLPAVLEMEPPKTRMDYEHFQLALTASGIDFRVFCDKRFMGADQNKRTAIPVHGVSPSQIEEWFTKDSLFHPKVIYLEDVDGKRILGAGSANLTLDGWGRNQEVFSFFEIKTKEQYQSAKDFFDIVAENVGILERLPLRRGLPSDESTWFFVHSFQNDTFLEQLFDSTKSSELLVWSPYLPKDLAGFIGRLITVGEMDDLKIHLVPDRIEGKYFRTCWTPELQALAKAGKITFYDNPSSRHDKVELSHAKVWKLDAKLAIGSWNFTSRGSNCSNEEIGEWNHDSNIEAGFIITDRSAWRDAVGKPIKLDASQFASDELLEQEALKVPEELPFDIWVNFDWREQKYSFAGRWITGKIDDNYAIKLPGLAEPVAICCKPKKKELGLASRVIKNPAELMLERRFQVLRNGEVLYHLLITETSLAFRRSQEYESLSDLLDAFVFGAESDPGDTVPFCLTIKQEAESFDNDFLDDAQIVTSTVDTNISFFRLFQAAHQYAQKIEMVNSAAELDSWIFSRPGCLLELVSKTKIKIAGPESGVFNWFLAQEVRTLCLKASKKKSELGSALNKERWNELEVSLPNLPKAIQAGYIEMIQKECCYARA